MNVPSLQNIVLNNGRIDDIPSLDYIREKFNRKHKCETCGLYIEDNRYILCYGGSLICWNCGCRE